MFQFVGPPVEIEPLKRKNMNGSRHYIVGDSYYPSVTSVTGNIPGKQEGLAKWRKRVGKKEADRISNTASTRGTNMHSICESYLMGEDYRLKSSPDALEMFGYIKGILDSNITNIFGLEERIYSHHLKLAGTVDCVAEWDGTLSIVDFKSSIRPKKIEWIENYFMQACAYSIMWEELTGMPVPRLNIVISILNATPELNSQVFSDSRDNWVEPLFGAIEHYNRIKNVSANGSHEN